VCTRASRPHGESICGVRAGELSEVSSGWASEVALVLVFVDKVPPPLPTQSEQAISLRARINASSEAFSSACGMCVLFATVQDY
jgi:hypothetical protein